MTEQQDQKPEAAEPSIEPAEAAPTNGGGAAAVSNDDLQQRLAALESEKKETWDRYVRAVAELDNVRKRNERELADLRRYAIESLARDLLPPIDNLERALESCCAEHSDNPVVAGVELTLRDLLKALDRHAVKPFESAGQPFDPARHQAVLQETTEDHPDNTVIREMQKGYLIHERLLRPAMVVVSRSETKASQTFDDAPDAA
jgi:molecular chaperone GrpE